MARFRHLLALLLALLLFAAPTAHGEEITRMVATPAMLQVPATQPAEGFAADGLEAVFYDGVPYRGKPTRVFAWIGIPKLKPGQKAPGIVLVHGGGGTAFEAWVRLWVDRGYAAIAMDTCGTVPRGSYGNWERHDASGPPGPDLTTAAEPIEDQWPYHAVADVLLAHSLLRARPEVDPDRIGLTGISWGGFLTCIVSGLDDRFKFAVPVYGCGFLDEHSVLKGQLAAAGDKAALWQSLWDPSHFLAAGKMPKLWVTGTNDFAFPMDSLQKSYQHAGGQSTLCVRLRMPHGHGGAGENPAEIHAFAESQLNHGPELPRAVSIVREGEQAIAHFQSERPIAKAELLYTTENTHWTDRLWQSTGASVVDATAAPQEKMHRATAALPSGTTAFFINIYDQHDCVVSTPHVVVEQPQP